MNNTCVSPRLDHVDFPKFAVESGIAKPRLMSSLAPERISDCRLPPISHILEVVEDEKRAVDPLAHAKSVINSNPTLWNTIAKLIKQNQPKKNKRNIRRENGSYLIHDNALDQLREKNTMRPIVVEDQASSIVAHALKTSIHDNRYNLTPRISVQEDNSRPAILMTKYRLNDMHEFKQRQLNILPRKVPEWKKHVQHFSLKRQM
jgi:hypothetical protein